MSSLLLRSSRTVVLRSAAIAAPAAVRASHLVVVPARRFATDNSSSNDTIWNQPIGKPIKAAAQEVAADMKHAAGAMKDGVKLKARQMQNSDVLEEAKEKATELGTKAKRAVNRASSKLADAIDPATGSGTARLHTSAARRNLGDDIKDDTNRLMQKAKNRSTSLGAELKEEGQALLHSAKKGMRNVKESVSGAMDDLTGSSPDARSPSEPVRQTTDSPELSTSRRDGHVIGGDGGSSLGETQSSVKKSIFDGPQEMPQGVGKRARDAEGQPMETGAPRT